VRTKEIKDGAFVFNRSTNPDEYWEELGSEMYVCCVAYTSSIKNEAFVLKIYDLIRELEAGGFERLPADDMVRKHIVTDCRGTITLCNRHLLKRRRKQIQQPHLFNRYCKQILLALFPSVAVAQKAKKRKQKKVNDEDGSGISPDVPLWALSVMGMKWGENLLMKE
jgi:hypothetical protein